MSVRIRLRRLGAKKRPFYRVVVADQRSPRDGRFIEAIGKYHPLDDPSLIEIDEERALEWLNKGAQPSQAVESLLRKTGIWEKFSAQKPQRPHKPQRPSSARTKTPTAKAGTAKAS
jgi:small subunit ribosomal protein S16